MLIGFSVTLSRYFLLAAWRPAIKPKVMAGPTVAPPPSKQDHRRLPSRYRSIKAFDNPPGYAHHLGIGVCPGTALGTQCAGRSAPRKTAVFQWYPWRRLACFPDHPRDSHKHSSPVKIRVHPSRHTGSIFSQSPTIPSGQYPLFLQALPMFLPDPSRAGHHRPASWLRAYLSLYCWSRIIQQGRLSGSMVFSSKNHRFLNMVL